MLSLGKISFKIKELDTVIWNVEIHFFTCFNLIYGTLMCNENSIKVRCE